MDTGALQTADVAGTYHSPSTQDTMDILTPARILPEAVQPAPEQPEEYVSLEELGITFDDMQEDIAQWGGNRRLSYLKRKLQEPCYEVVDATDGQ